MGSEQLGDRELLLYRIWVGGGGGGGEGLVGGW